MKHLQNFQKISTVPILQFVIILMLNAKMIKISENRLKNNKNFSESIKIYKKNVRLPSQTLGGSGKGIRFCICF